MITHDLMLAALSSQARGNGGSTSPQGRSYFPSSTHATLRVIFDFDGVVIDSHRVHGQSWFALAEEIGKTLTPEQFHATFGQRNETIIPFLGWSQDAGTIKKLGNRKEVIYREIMERDGIEALSGVIGFLFFLLVKDDVF